MHEGPHCAGALKPRDLQAVRHQFAGVAARPGGGREEIRDLQPSAGIERIVVEPAEADAAAPAGMAGEVAAQRGKRGLRMRPAHRLGVAHEGEEVRRVGEFRPAQGKPGGLMGRAITPSPVIGGPDLP